MMDANVLSLYSNKYIYCIHASECECGRYTAARPIHKNLLNLSASYCEKDEKRGEERKKQRCVLCGCAENIACVCWFATVCLFNFGNFGNGENTLGRRVHQRFPYDIVIVKSHVHNLTHTHEIFHPKRTIPKQTKPNRITLADKIVFKKTISHIYIQGSTYTCIHTQIF